MRVDPKILAFERHEVPNDPAVVIFSTSLVMNMVNGAVFLGAPFDAKVVAGGSSATS